MVRQSHGTPHCAIAPLIHDSFCSVRRDENGLEIDARVRRHVPSSGTTSRDERDPLISLLGVGLHQNRRCGFIGGLSTALVFRGEARA
jgi:hypothetical protein